MLTYALLSLHPYIERITHDYKVFQHQMEICRLLLLDRTMEEVVARANATKYGLAAGVLTKNIDVANHVTRSIKAGTIWVNTYNVLDPAVPFGGYKMSGFGRENGIQGLHEYLQTKAVITQLFLTSWL